MWTGENRGLYERGGPRYPSDLKDDEWALIAPLIPPAKRGGRRREVDVCEVKNGVLYVLETGCQWRALPKDLPPKSRCTARAGASLPNISTRARATMSMSPSKNMTGLVLHPVRFSAVNALRFRAIISVL